MTVVFLCTTNRGAEIVVVSFGELRTPRPIELLAAQREVETLLDPGSAQPRPTSAARPTDDDRMIAIVERARDANQL